MRVASRSKTPKKKTKNNKKNTSFKSDHKIVESLKLKGYEGRELARKREELLKR